jgi:two-component system sensor histidine kinase BaeS
MKQHQDVTIPSASWWEETPPRAEQPARFAIGTRELAPLDPEDIAEEPLGGLDARDVAQLAHDLRMSISEIELQSDLLRRSFGSHTPREASLALERIDGNAAFLEQMTYELLDLCAYAAGTLELRRRPTELSALLGNVISRVVPSRDSERVFLLAPPATANVDGVRIERVVANLLLNALKYTPEEASIVVALIAKGRHVRITVTDGGPGMTARDAAGVFGRYQRAETARGSEGNGLGLYISRKIVEAHGGTIGLSTTCGVGSQFFVELPRVG